MIDAHLDAKHFNPFRIQRLSAFCVRLGDQSFKNPYHPEAPQNLFELVIDKMIPLNAYMKFAHLF